MLPRCSRHFSILLSTTFLLTACPEPVPSDPGVQGSGPGDSQGAAPQTGATQGGQPQGGQPNAPAQSSSPEAPNPNQLRQADGASQLTEDRPLLDLSMPVPDLTTQDALKSQGNFITVRGTLTGDACKGKQIRVDALEITSTIRRLMTLKELRDIGAYEMLLPKSSNPVEILAACDTDGDKKIFPNKDLVGHYDQNPISGSEDTSGVDIELKKEFGPTAGGNTPAPGSVPSPAGAAGPAPAGPADAKAGMAPAGQPGQKGAKAPAADAAKVGAGTGKK